MRPRQRIACWRMVSSVLGGSHRSRYFEIALVIVLALSVLTGCSGVFSFGKSIGQVVGDSLHADVHKSNASVDFRKLVAGSWTRMLIICGPVSRTSVDRALGFVWTPPGGKFEVNDSILLFVDQSSVVAHYVGQVDDTLEDEEFTPCFPPDFPNDGKIAVRQVIPVARRDTVVTLTNDESAIGHVWFIGSIERARLAAIMKPRM